MSWDRVCKEIESQPKLTAEQEQALCQADQEGGTRAKAHRLHPSLRPRHDARPSFQRSWKVGAGRPVRRGHASALRGSGRWGGKCSCSSYTLPRVQHYIMDSLLRELATSDPAKAFTLMRENADRSDFTT